jgi:hypothetical protein
MQPVGNYTHVRSAISVQAEVEQGTTSTRSSQSDNRQIAPRMLNKNMIFVDFPQASKSTRVGGPQLRRPKMDERARENIVNQIRKKNGIALPDQVNSQAKQIALVEALDRAYSYESLAETAKDMWTWMATATRSLSSYMPDIQIGPPAVEAGLLSNVIEVTKPSTISEFLKSYQNDFDIQISRSLKLDDSVKGVTIIVGTKEKDQSIDEKIARVLAGMKDVDGDLLFIPGFTMGCESALKMYKLRYANCKELDGDFPVKSNVPLEVQKLVLFQAMMVEQTKVALQISNLIKKTTDTLKKMKSIIDQAGGLDLAEIDKMIDKEEFQDYSTQKKVDPSSIYVGNWNYMDMEDIYSKFNAAIDDGKRLKVAIDGSITINPYKSIGESLVNTINSHHSDGSTKYAVIEVDDLFTVADKLYDDIVGNAIVMVPHGIYKNTLNQNLLLQRDSKRIDL